MRAQLHRDNDSASGSSGGRRADAGRHHLLTPSGVLRLQRTAGNTAVSDAIAVQRKHVGKEMLEFSDGTINGMVDGKQWSLSVTDGWVSG